MCVRACVPSCTCICVEGIGHGIQNRLLERLEREKTQAIESAEMSTWEKAEKQKHSAVKRVREEAAKKIDQALEDQRKEYEKKIKVNVLVTS